MAELVVGRPTIYGGRVSVHLAATYGASLLAFMLGLQPETDPATIEAAELSHEQAELLSQLEEAAPATDRLARTVPAVSAGYHLTDWVRSFDPGKLSPALGFRAETVGLPALRSNDRLLGLLQTMALDALPGLLADQDANRRARALTGLPWTDYASPLLASHPLTDDVSAAVLADPDLGTLFDPASGPHAASPLLMYSSGAGGSIQLSILPATLVAIAWEQAADRSPEGVLVAVEDALEAARAAARHDPVRVVANVGLTGATLEAPVELPWGMLRPEREGDFATRLGDGPPDVSIVLEVPVRVRCVRSTQSEPGPGAGADPELRRTIDDAVRRTTLTVMLASPDGEPTGLVPVTETIRLPLLSGRSMSWRPAGPPFRRAAITPEDHDSLRRWASLIEAHDHPSLVLPVTRSVRAAGERWDPTDALIDAVIALESLFTSKDAKTEQRFRASAAVAWLIEPSNPERRAACFKRVQAVYDERSKVVHGVQVKPPDVMARSSEAIGLAVQALRVLFAERPDLIPVADRSRVLILGLPAA